MTSNARTAAITLLSFGLILLLGISQAYVVPCYSNEDANSVHFNRSSNATLYWQTKDNFEISFRVFQTELGTILRVFGRAGAPLFSLSIKDACIEINVSRKTEQSVRTCLRNSTMAGWHRFRVEIRPELQTLVVSVGESTTMTIDDDFGGNWSLGDPLVLRFGGFTGCLTDIFVENSHSQRTISPRDFNQTAHLTPCLCANITRSSLISTYSVHPTPLYHSSLRSTPITTIAAPTIAVFPKTETITRAISSIAARLSNLPVSYLPTIDSTSAIPTPSQVWKSKKEQLRVLMEAIENGSADVAFVAEAVRNLTSNVTGLGTEEVNIAVDLLETIVEQSSDSGVVEDVMESMSHLMDVNSDELHESQKSNNTSVRLLGLIDIMAKNISVDTWEYGNIKLHVIRVDPDKQSFRENDSFTFYGLSKKSELQLSGEALRRPLPNGLHRWWFVSFKNHNLFEEVKGSGNVTGEVIAASVSTGTVQDLTDRIELVFWKTSGNSSACVFWKFDGSSELGGYWSRDGCVIKEQNESAVVCLCNHLTHFTIIADGEEDTTLSPQLQTGIDLEEKFAMYAGSGIALLFLSVAFLTFVCFRIVHSKRSAVHANLCLCLMVSNTLFVVSISDVSSEAVCKGVAISLHLFIVLTFSWLVGEAVELCHAAFGQVGQWFDRHRLKLLIPFCWGLSIVYVGLWSYFKYDYYGNENNSFCLVHVDYAWIVMGPVTGLSGVAFLLWLFATCAFCLKTEENYELEVQLRLKKIGLLLIGMIQALSWTAALVLLYWEFHLDVLAYVFGVGTALESLFVFVFLCVLDSKVRDKYIQMCGCQGGKDLTSSSKRASVLANPNATMGHYSLNVPQQIEEPRIEEPRMEEPALGDQLFVSANRLSAIEMSSNPNILASTWPSDEEASEVASQLGDLSRWSSTLSASVNAFSTPQHKSYMGKQVSFAGSSVIDEVLSNDNSAIFVQSVSLAELREIEREGQDRLRTYSESADNMVMESRL
eukprot:m.23077 g.23077  ORF g.23077 m.23077 type:complete len:993 (+) comp28435_c0_seq1:156-3134(+)